MLILGVSALISNLYVQKNTVLYEIPFVCFISLLLMFMGWQYGMISRGSAAILCLLFALFVLYLFIVSQPKKQAEIPVENMSVWKMAISV